MMITFYLLLLFLLYLTLYVCKNAVKYTFFLFIKIINFILQNYDKGLVSILFYYIYIQINAFISTPVYSFLFSYACFYAYICTRVYEKGIRISRTNQFSCSIHTYTKACMHQNVQKKVYILHMCCMCSYLTAIHKKCSRWKIFIYVERKNFFIIFYAYNKELIV